MACLGIPYKSISGIKFSCFKNEEKRNLSVKRAYNPHSFDALDCSVVGGLYDDAFGSYTKSRICSTCQHSSYLCTGHLGHIDLPVPVFNPLFFKNVLHLLHLSCTNCKKFYAKQEAIQLLAFQMEMLMNGNFDALYEYENIKLLLDENCHIKSFFEYENKAENLQDTQFSRKNWTRHSLRIHRKLFQDFADLSKTVLQEKKPCPHCKHKYVIFGGEYSSRIFIKEDSSIDAKRQYVSPLFVMEHLNAVWNNEQKSISRIYNMINFTSNNSQQNPENSSNCTIDNFFLQSVIVPASKFRPPRFVNGMTIEDPQTSAFSKVLLDCKIITLLLKKVNNSNEDPCFNDIPLQESSMKILKKDVIETIPGNTFSEKLGNAWHRLQQHVNAIIDSDLDRLAVKNVKSVGIRQMLEKKEGLFRKFMMGKRVNFAARSVISPDPYIATNEIGIPLVFALKLTFPTPVTSWNIKKLRQAVVNGPMGYPGATHVIKNGCKIRLSENNKSQRLAVAKQLVTLDENVDNTNMPLQQSNVVLRYLQNGDVLLLNRQPTLHRGSIMAHKARVLQGEKTLRLHYANCKSYNADFDGDEMNAHYPQSELGRAEAINLMLTDMQYLSAKDGKPLSCLIQDHVVAGVHMCIRGRFFHMDEYHSLLYSALMQIPYKIKLLHPAIMKPQMLWSGKQVVSTILLNVIPNGTPLLNLKSKSKISSTDLHNENAKQFKKTFVEKMSESQVIIRQGELLCGILDKAHFGAAEFGLIHAIFELYGGSISGKILTCFARLFTSFLQLYKGFTLGVSDILTTANGDAQRKEIIKVSSTKSFSLVAHLHHIENNNSEGILNLLQEAHSSLYLDMKHGGYKMSSIDHSMKKLSNSINNEISLSCSGQGLLRIFPQNNLQLMVLSGAKGGLVNCLQISCSLGQIELEGRRPRLTLAGRTSPSFKPYEASLRAGGFVTQRFLTGLRPQEYYFHCMAGREGLVDTAIKTSNSGYLQRCLVKSLECLVLSYDLTVRDNDGAVVQFLYGEDGIDVGKSPFLSYKHFDFLLENITILKKQMASLPSNKNLLNEDISNKKWKKIMKCKNLNKNGKYTIELEKNISEICNFEENPIRNLSQVQESTKITCQSVNLIKKANIPDPVLSILRPDLHFGSISEKYHDSLHQFFKSYTAQLCEDAYSDNNNIASNLKRMAKIFKFHYQQSLCEPGEYVGLLAAQSVGEPSTQMTLNTFHFAGRGEMNVTLGIPRLREILMSNVKCPHTPNISVPVLSGKLKEAENLCKRLASVTVNKVLQTYQLEECVNIKGSNCSRKCILTLSFLPIKYIETHYGITLELLLTHIKEKFLFSLVEKLATEIKKVVNAGASDYVYDLSKNINQNESMNDLFDTEMDTLNSGTDVDDEVENIQTKRADEIEYDDASHDVAPDDNELKKTLNYYENTDTTSVSFSADMKDHQEIINSHGKHALPINNNVAIVLFEYKISSNQSKIIIQIPLDSFSVNLLSLITFVTEQSYIQKTPEINQCMLINSEQDDTIKLMIDGLNFLKIFENQHCLDIKRLYSNCIHSMQCIYGIEAARQVIEQEVINVFAVYGIEINKRHLSLLADYMCVEGIPKGCNRTAMITCSSPLQQITFETSCNFLTNAALHGITDNMSSPSANVVAGRLVKAGTGSFSLVYPLNP